MKLPQRKRRESRPAVKAFGSLLAALLWLSGAAYAETQIVIDPTEVPETQKSAPPAAKKPAQSDAALIRSRQRAEEEQRRRAKAETRALAAERESAKLREAAKLRAAEQARQAEAASRANAIKLASQKAAAARAESARVATAKIIKEDLAQHEASRKPAAGKQSTAMVLAAKEAAAKELAAMELAAKEAAARELAAKELAAKELAAKELAAKEAAKELAAKELAAKELAAREKAARERDAKEWAARNAAVRSAAAREATVKEIPARRVQPRFGTVFRDCANCPELVWLPEGEFIMGEPGANTPQRRVKINYMLAVGRFEVTFAEWDACVAAGGCRRRPADAGWGRGWQPVINVSWADASQYTAWLSRLTGKNYRLLSDAEWEYAARAGSDVRFWWGNNAGQGNANCSDCGSRWDGNRPAPVGRFGSNPFGLHDMHGNVAEWVADCHHDRYKNASRNGEAWSSSCSPDSDTRMLRGGTWDGPAHTVRSAARATASQNAYDNRTGFRVARTD